MAIVEKMYADVPADVRLQSDRAKDAYPFAADAKDFIVAEAEVDGLLPLKAAVYAPRALKVAEGQNTAAIKGLIAKADTEFGQARRFAAVRSSAAKTAARAISIWNAIEQGDAARAERAAKVAKVA